MKIRIIKDDLVRITIVVDFKNDLVVLQKVHKNYFYFHNFLNEENIFNVEMQNIKMKMFEGKSCINFDVKY